MLCGVSAAGEETGYPGAPGGGGEGEDHPHTAVGAAVEGEDKVRARTCVVLWVSSASTWILHGLCFSKLAHANTFLHTSMQPQTEQRA